jgi:L-lysine 2,3-aminomutase
MKNMLCKKDKSNTYPQKVPSSFAKRIKQSNLQDPLLLQVMPQEREMVAISKKNAEYKTDPLGEAGCMPLPGLLHKYYGRVLLLLTKDCPINCRFCFRRHMRQRVENWPKVLAYLAKDQTISEVILSGGEPLLWSNKQLAELLKRLADIQHVKRVRIHTRVPIVTPERIDRGLLQVVKKQKMPIIFVVHCNHPQEINAEVVRKLRQLHANSYAVLNQTVLLHGINDDPKVLIALSEKLFAAKVLPYYLHMLDKVKGSSHFYVSEKKARKLLCELKIVLPGYLVPKLVRDEVGKKAKIELVSC